MSLSRLTGLRSWCTTLRSGCTLVHTRCRCAMTDSSTNAAMTAIEDHVGTLSQRAMVRQTCAEASPCQCVHGLRRGGTGVVCHCALQPPRGFCAVQAEASCRSGACTSAAQAPQQQPIVLVVSGPSGVGKDAVVNHLRQLRPDLHFVVTATSRCALTTALTGCYLSHRRDIAPMLTWACHAPMRPARPARSIVTWPAAAWHLRAGTHARRAVARRHLPTGLPASLLAAS